MIGRTKAMVAGTAATLALATGGAAIAATTGGDDADRPIEGPALERASAAALAHTKGGRVTETEAGDEEGAYEVEVTLDGGRQVDVHLDGGFRGLSQVADVD